ncbi:unnamed protein product [Adineta ricciae]|uniref:Protein kinase C n=1 Tax=Adineta ricciae TaxID=249248 RepID=A0A814JA15_ADIRI|nr:unnamed protein product [Adineta ricciae]
MATNNTAPSSQQQRVSVYTSLSARTIQATLKYGLHQSDREYSGTNPANPIIEQIYADAEKWIPEILSSAKNSKPNGRFVLNLYRISSSDFEITPIRCSSDVEQNSLIEIILVPVESDERPHCLYECQFHVPTFCAKCTRFIAGLYKQGYRCSKCRLAFHKDCAPFLEDDCPVDENRNQNSRAAKAVPVLLIINPFPRNSVSEDTPKSARNLIPSVKEASAEISSDTIIDKGIFPACIRNTNNYRRYLFRLTPSTVSLSTNLSTKHVVGGKTDTNKNDLVFSLVEIQDLILTDRMPHSDSIFEIHIRNKFILSVGKKSDSDGLQMETAQFYMSIRDQWEASINSSPASSAASTPTNHSTPRTTSPKSDVDRPRKLQVTKSNFRLGEAELHDRYILTGEKIGQGGFGRVVGAIKKATKEPRAVKIIEKDNCSELEIKRINDEVQHLYTFNHINILKLEAYYERHNALYIVTERLQTDMCEYIMTRENSHLDEEAAKMLIYQVIVALRYLHDNECSHLDIKCENILLCLLQPIPLSNSQQMPNGIDHRRDFPLVKLADFGYSRVIGEHSFRKTFAGTKVYSPPEMHNPKPGYNRLADMWSAGVVLYAALSGTLPFSEKDCSNYDKIVEQRKTIFDDERWAYVSDFAQNLLDKHLLVVDINSRAKPNTVLFHDWFTDPQLYRDLREIERRARHHVGDHQEITPGPKWLTTQRNDAVWKAYQTQ